MNLKRLLFSLMFMAIFFLSGLGFTQDEEARHNQSLGAKEDLSYTQDQTWFKQKQGKSEVSQSGQIQPWRQATWEERVNYFIESLKKGDRKVFLYVEYGLLGGYGNPAKSSGNQIGTAKGYPTNVGSHISLGVIHKLAEEARVKQTKVEKVLTGDDAKVRANVINATLSGLFNKDPRVRLVAVNLLRRLRPDPSMARDVKRALLLETVTTERSKWREKDIDIPSIENPRLGWGAVSWATGSSVRTPLNAKYDDGINDGQEGLLDGRNRGQYLRDGLYGKSDRNDYPLTGDEGILDTDHNLVESTNPDLRAKASVRKDVWTKASLLRYGADEQVSRFEVHYGLKVVEVMPRYVYAYVDFHDPLTERGGETVVTGYHSVWEEMKKLDLFITRALWVDRIKKGDIDSLRLISKDSFRALADQIDGESLENVPMKSKDFKVFAEPEVRAIIVGMLENRVVSTREECVIFLKRIFDRTQTSVATKREIKKALREARRRELIIDTIRGRHLHSELIVTRQPDDWWGERDEIDTSRFGANRSDRSRMLQIYRNQVEFPEETDIIYADRRKPGQEDDDDDDAPKKSEATSGGGKKESTTSSSSKGAESSETDEYYLGHPLLKESAITLNKLKEYLKIDNIASEKVETTSKQAETKPVEKVEEKTKKEEPKKSAPSDSADDDDDDDFSEPGQYSGDKLDKGSENRVFAQMYEKIRAIETLHSLLLARGDDLLKVSFKDLQNAVLILQLKILNKIEAARTKSPDAVKNDIQYDFLTYLFAGSAVASNQGRRINDHRQLGLELTRKERTDKAVANLLSAIDEKVSGLKLGNVQKDINAIKDLRSKYNLEKGYVSKDEREKDLSETRIVPPGRSGDPELRVLDDKSKRDVSEKSHGRFYGHGHGGYYKFYDQQFTLEEQSGGLSTQGQAADARKINEGVYQFHTNVRGYRDRIIQALLVALGDKDPQKRLLIIHLLRRLIPEASMLPKINKLLRELETVDKKPYLYFSTILGQAAAAGEFAVIRQEKIVGHELLKLQRFIVRRILVNKIRSGAEPDFLKEIPKGSFLTLVVRIDAEWDPFRIPLRTPIPINETGSNGMFFTKKDLDVIRGGLENRNFLIQRETARWIVSFYNLNRNVGGHIGDPGDDAEARKFVRAVKFAEKRDIVYFERNYVQWRYTPDYGQGKYSAATSRDAKDLAVTAEEGVIGVPVGRVPVRVGTLLDRDVFRKIDNDRFKEFETEGYGRTDAGKAKVYDKFEEASGGRVRNAYQRLLEERNKRKAEKLGDSTRDDVGLDFKGQ